MNAPPSRSDGMEARPVRVAAPVRSDRGGSTSAPFELPLEQAMALAQVPPDGVPESQLEHLLGMTSAEAARVREVLLRRKLVRRTPPGRVRVTSRLVLTDRGQQGVRWLEQLQSSLPPALFDPAELPPAGPLKLVDGVSRPELIANPSSGLFARMHGLWSASDQGDPAAELETAPEEVFGRGFLNVTLGTGFFGTAVVVGIMLQSERDALIALGVGCLLAVIFFLRAGAGLFRHARVRAWFARRLRRLGEDRSPEWPRRRPRSGRAAE